jgi:hypothetical protein
MTTIIIVIITVVIITKEKVSHKMSALDAAIWERISQLIYSEKRYFDYLDFFPKFKVNGQVYSISYGTFRNKMSALVKAGNWKFGSILLKPSIL